VDPNNTTTESLVFLPFIVFGLSSPMKRLLPTLIPCFKTHTT
jgi:hypothetical protein